MGSPLYSEGSYHFDTQDVGRPKKGQEARARDEKEPIGSFFNSGNRYALKKKINKKFRGPQQAQLLLIPELGSAGVGSPAERNTGLRGWPRDQASVGCLLTVRLASS